MDWKLLIGEAQKYLTQPQIAAMCGCAQATISDLASGATTEPRYSLGDALRALHARCVAGEFPLREGPKPAGHVARDAAPAEVR